MKKILLILVASLAVAVTPNFTVLGDTIVLSPDTKIRYEHPTHNMTLQGVQDLERSMELIKEYSKLARYFEAKEGYYKGLHDQLLERTLGN